jgi:hypothetical protein
MRRKRCAIYAIGPTSSVRTVVPMKIGVAMDITRRLYELQTSHWLTLKLYDHRWAKNTTVACAIESKTHKLLKDKHIQGEWFNISANDACIAIEAAAEELGHRVATWQEHLDNHLTFAEEWALYENSSLTIAPGEPNSISEEAV